MSDVTIVAIIGISGTLLAAIAGTYLTHWFTRHREEEKYQQSLRTQAYIDFLRSVSMMVKAQEYGDKLKWQEYTALGAETRMRISAYGSRNVVEAILDFVHKGSKTDTPEGYNAFINIIQAMREDCLSYDQSITDAMISEMVFSPEIRKKFEPMSKI